MALAQSARGSSYPLRIVLDSILAPDYVELDSGNINVAPKVSEDVACVCFQPGRESRCYARKGGEVKLGSVSEKHSA